MEERQQWLSIAAVVLVIAGLGFFLYRQSRNNQPEEPVDVTEQQQQEAEQRGEEVAERLNIEVPEGAEREAFRATGETQGAGLVSRIERDGQLAYSFAVDLPDPQTGEFYEAYAVGEGEEREFLGRLRQAKGGWLLETSISAEISGLNRVIITRETQDDQTPEEVVLETQFE